jgi:hypothetical protein
MTEGPTTNPPRNPLVVEPENEDAQPLDWVGAGVLSGWSDVGSSLVDGNYPKAAFSAVGAGLDTLDAIESPFDTLLETGFGWLIEHVWFLHEPLDALAGDPTQITASARTWHNVANELGQVATEHRAAATALPGWEGPARDAYRVRVDQYGSALDVSAQNAAGLADLLVSVGAQVGTVRSLIRDGIATFLAAAVQWLAQYLVLAPATGGAALAACAVQVVRRATDLAHQIGDAIAKLIDSLATSGQSAKALADAVRDAATRVAPQAQRGAGALGENLATVAPDAAIEAGKQYTGAEHEQAGWTPATR